MASYKSGFDPPTRPGEVAGGRRTDLYTPRSPPRKEYREADIAHISGQMDPPQRRGNTPVGSRTQTGLPRPSMRAPSPNTFKSIPPPSSKTIIHSNYPFARAGTDMLQAIPLQANPQDLRTKSPRNVLRRKPTSVANGSGNVRTNNDGSVLSSPARPPSSQERRPSEASIMSQDSRTEIFTRPVRTRQAPRENPIIPELDRYRNIPEQNAGANYSPGSDLPHRLATQDLPPPTPLLSQTPGYSSGGNTYRYSGYGGSVYSASPSTRFSESPGPGAYSRDTTPTSMSSQASSIMAPLKTTTPRLRQQGSPALTRPPLSRRRAGSIPNESEGPAMDPQGLPSLRESLTSSSSNSTVKGDNSTKAKKKKKRLSPLPPSPPPRKSSQKLRDAAVVEQQSPSKPSLAPAKPVMMPESSPLKLRTPAPALQTKNIPPSRPSRDGAPDLQTSIETPVIQSNLAGFSFAQDKRSSLLPPPRSAVTSPLQGSSIKSQQSSRLPSRNQSPSPGLQNPGRDMAPAGLGIIPDLRPQTSSGATRTPSPSVSSGRSRFGLFTRRTKTNPEVDNKDKTVRKGPTAGTGHEGYGKYGLRKRSSSTGGLGHTRDRSFSTASSSQESFASIPAPDPFLLQRISPVVIAGGGGIIERRQASSSELPRTGSDTSLLLDRPSIDSKGSVRSGLSQEVSRTTLWPSALPKESSKRTSGMVMPKSRRPSDSSDDGYAKSSLAFRRSIQRLNNSTSALNLPRQLKISGVASASTTSVVSDESQLEMRDPYSRRGSDAKNKKLEKRPRSPRKWNFFHRTPAPKPEPQPSLPVQVVKPAAKAVPHYALLDSSDDQQDQEGVDLEDILRDAEVPGLSNEELDVLQFGEIKNENRRRLEEIQNMILPQAAPELSPEPEPVPEPVSEPALEPAPVPIQELAPAATLFTTPEPFEAKPFPLPEPETHVSAETAPTRPSRLPQVGRIPKVISARPRTTSPKSFSRPFARLSISQPTPELPVIDKHSVALGPSPPKPSTPEPQQSEVEPVNESPERKISEDSKSSSTAASHRDFLAFSPRKNSEATTSSSGGHSYAGTTAVVPDPDAALGEDEVWDEFDDLLENNEDTVKVPTSATSSQGHPFQYESYESRRMRRSKMQQKESAIIQPTPTINEPLNNPAAIDHHVRRSALTASSVYSRDLSGHLNNGLATPTTPMSFTDFFSGYGDRNNSVYGDSAKKPSQSSPESRKSNSSGSHSRSVSERKVIEEQESTSPISQVNLRVGSMTVSKWLTFGHVLFSPARDEVMQLEGSGKAHSILVIDGLGNDDWSFYAAETYPNSTFYNLSPTRPLSASQRTEATQSFPLSPPNHRQIQYTSTSQKFPFPSSTFHVVVFRFPTCMSEAHYRNVVAESKRVLKPAGYLEMAILDLDMMNMGNRARRAVRGLKLRIQSSDPTISLASASDTVLRIVGKRGFSDIKSCKVGVPVASTIPSASDKEKGQEEMSLADMMKDESRAGDEGITKMVAKVGRWWYTRCYETATIPDGDASRSIFNDSQLLRECETWNASFKLVVAYAQKPVVGRRRTASV